MNSKKILDEFEESVLSAVAKAGDRGIPLAGAMRPYMNRASENGLRYRVQRLARQNQIQIEDIMGRKLLLPVEE